MNRSSVRIAVVTIAAGVLLSTAAYSRALFDPEDQRNPYVTSAVDGPNYGIGFHNVGQIAMSVVNNGTFGLGFVPLVGLDFCTGERALDCEYPKGSNTQYLFSSTFWIGAVVGRDTLVSVGGDGWRQDRELYPLPGKLGGIICRSIVDPTAPEYEGAVSEEDFIAVYQDTWTGTYPSVLHEFDAIDGRPHIPLDIEITQRTYAWSYDYADDFVLFDYSIENIGTKRLTEVYMGIYVDADVGHTSGDGQVFAQDDICGFVFDAPSPPEFSGGCPFRDTVFIAWIADNDGDLDAGLGGSTEGGGPVPNVTGTRIIRTPSDSLRVSFNWWVSNSSADRDFGPRHRSDTRDLGTGGGQGTPEGDRNKYWFMRNGEFDYDQPFVGTISPIDTLWKTPPSEAPNISQGYDTRYLLSFGPFNIDPGQKLPLSFAHVGGLGFHTVENNVENLPDYPQRFYENLDFTKLTKNATWASWVYDNPGVDTDNNGYRGKRRICVQDADTTFDTTNFDPLHIDTLVLVNGADTIWYEGDGVPDFRGASPPPAPFVYLEPKESEIRVRWNGYLSETTRDAFSQIIDFEGYRVWYGRDDRDAAYQLAISYDIENFNKYFWDDNLSPEPGWNLKEPPFSAQELHDAYGDLIGDSLFDPLMFSQRSPLLVNDSILYFGPQDFNVSDLGVPGGIRKVYGDTISYPSSLDPDFAQPHELTPEGNLKYFEYEYTIESLLPTVEYWVTVTAFDFGSPQSGLAALETARSLNAKSSYALPNWDAVQAQDLKAYIYPNPYRIDGGYLENGYELPTSAQTNTERLRRIHFANLPPKCKIRIFSLDGDLVRELDHDKDPNDPDAPHETWDLITRNTQAVVSGLYYWVVEEESGDTQMGKLMIIK